MKILSIETSCDETAVSLVEATGGLDKPEFKILGNSLFSQIELHKEYGGVFPTVAKREHAKNLTPLLVQTLTQANEFSSVKNNYNEDLWGEIKHIVSKEIGLYDTMRNMLETVARPDIEIITVTYGPGLEPALWVGISFALALGTLWQLPVIPTNHMEGHIASVLMNNHAPIAFPALALLISGGHTELVHIEEWGTYKIIGQTRDDAVGEAFDKVARLLGLPYPGGPEISRLAEAARTSHLAHTASFPRPMIHSHDFDFSFSGLKTAVLYYIRDFTATHGQLTPEHIMDIAREFEDAVVEVLLSKTKKALEETGACTLIIAGGVIANKTIRAAFSSLEKLGPNPLSVQIPMLALATDNAVMIACAAYIQATVHPEILSSSQVHIVAKGNLKF